MSASAGQALEAALVANPDDLGAHAAYADWLIEQGDPRGEFIQVQLALEDPKVPAQQRTALQRREKALLKAHGRAWLGELAPFLWSSKSWLTDLTGLVWGKKADQVEYAFARGWLDKLAIDMLTGPLLRALAQAPQARLLRTLAVVDMDNPWRRMLARMQGEKLDDADYPELELLSESPYLGNLRQLSFGNSYDLRESSFIYTPFSRRHLDKVAALVERLPRLEQLSLEGHMDPEAVGTLFGVPTLHHLRSLQICFASGYPLEVLAQNSSLGRLDYILFHAESHESTITRDGLRPLLQSPHLKSLTRLRLHQHTIGDEGCAEIVFSGILKRLKVLDLGFGNISDDGAHLLAACPDLRNLELLDLQRNGLTRKGIARLRKLGIDVHVEQQHDPGDESYLYEGEME
jgi:uncharacterized protein (TIGR02996 family)